MEGDTAYDFKKRNPSVARASAIFVLPSPAFHRVSIFTWMRFMKTALSVAQIPRRGHPFSRRSELRHNTNATPILTWSVKDSSGAEDKKIAENGHIVMSADGASQAIGTVINTSNTPSFTFTGPTGCIFVASGNTVTLTASTNFGSAKITASLTNADVCLVTNFWFDFTACNSCSQATCPKDISNDSVDALRLGAVTHCSSGHLSTK